MTNSVVPNQNFLIRPQIYQNPINRNPPTRVQRANKQDMGATGTTIPISSFMGGVVTVSPATVQTYFVPPANNILGEFGEPLGVPNLGTGDQILFDIINRGTAPAYIQANSGSYGGDGTTIIAYPGAFTASSTGSTGSTPLGRHTTITLEFTNVSAGGPTNNSNIGTIQNGTGSYTLYN